MESSEYKMKWHKQYDYIIEGRIHARPCEEEYRGETDPRKVEFSFFDKAAD